MTTHGGGMAGVVQITADHLLGHAEPDIAVNPRNSADLIGACQFILAARLRVPGAFASLDGGRTWRNDGVLPLPHGYEQGADTTVAFDRHGTGFVAALMAHGGGGYASRVTKGGIFLWRTNDGGRHFSQPQPVYVGHGFQDHPWLAIRGKQLSLAWTNSAGLNLSQSNNDGRSFSAPRVLVPGSAPADPVITVTRRRVRVFFQEFDGSQIRIEVLDSSDGGATFAHPQLIADAPAPPPTGGPKGGGMPPPLIGATASPDGKRAAVALAVQDASVGHPVIEVWQTDPARGWQGPIRISTGLPATMSQEQPRLLFAHRRIYVLYLTLSRQGQTDVRLAQAPIASDHFTSQSLTPTPFAEPSWLGDYQGLTAANNTAYAAWNDGHTGHLEIVAHRFPLR